MSGRHPHADEKRKPSIERQLEGTGLFGDAVQAMNEDENRYRQTVLGQGPLPGYPVVERDPPPGPHRVSRRSMTQDAAHAKATAHAPPMREQIYEHLLGILPRGQTREEIAKAFTPPMKLQTVCGRVHDLLTWTVEELPAPRVREGDKVNGSALVYAIPRSHSHTHDPKP
jgi:hypothetical protein